MADCKPCSKPLISPLVMLSGERLGGLLVEGKLAACVNMVPRLTSIYE